MPDLPLISIVIPNYNGAAYLENCLRSLLAQDYPRKEIVVVDNASRDQSVELVLAIAPGALILRQPYNAGFAGGANAGIRAASGDWIAVLNNDTEVAGNWLSECVRAIERHPEAAFLACKILCFKQRDRIYSAGDCFLRCGIGYRRGQDRRDGPNYDRECEMFSACGCAALYRASLLRELGGYDERFSSYLEDVELGLRLQAVGHLGYYLPGAKVYHHGGATSGGEFSPLSVRLRTRNSLFLLFKCLPASILLRCLPMIATAQLSWLARSVAHKQIISYLRGLAEALVRAPTLVKARADLRPHWHRTRHSLWQKILASEAMARQDFSRPASEGISVFLKWYFRLF